MIISDCVNVCIVLSFKYVKPVVYVSSKRYRFSTLPRTLEATIDSRSPKLSTILNIFALTCCEVILCSKSIGSIKGVTNLFKLRNKCKYYFHQMDLYYSDIVLYQFVQLLIVVQDLMEL